MPVSSNSPYKSELPVTTLPLVGPKYAEKLENLGISTIKDLLFHFPWRYSDTREIDSIEELKKKGEGTIQATVEVIQNTRTRSRKFLTKAVLSDHSGKIAAVWFNQPYLTKSIKKDETYLMSGKVSRKWGVNLQNPQYEKVADQDFEGETTHLGKLSPVYPETFGISSKWLRARIKPLRKYISDLVEDPIPQEIREDEKLTELAEAVEKIHFPETPKDIRFARRRIGLDELIEIQKETLKFLAERKNKQTIQIKADFDDSEVATLLDSLDFELTSAQETAAQEILEDIGKEQPMHRLLNGDVGSGKTIVALIAAVATHASGHTTVIMAPTTILANQHYQTITSTLKNAKLDIPLTLITSSQKSEITEDPQILIGTHALLYDQDLPDNTAFVIIDEQHRFGVAQRETLEEFGTKTDNTSPHYLTMTATPIPRTLTLAIYGYSDVSVIDEMPEGRTAPKTYLVPEKKRQDSYDWISEKIKEGEQAFVICPLIEDSEKVEAKAAKEEFKRLQDKIFPRHKLALVHGQLKEKKKTQILADFKGQKYQVLVATPVVEVGIDIPNANIMIIENAERFGLAQLHQFRGRIGRGDRQSFCFLFTDSHIPDTLERLTFFSKNESGFKVAEYDLKNRGPGEVYGLRQSGILNLRFADITDLKQVKKAQRIAKRLLGS